ncbi:MAG: hypothetical protein AAB737_02745, partial [Patescibacteria group bacterium]
GGFTAYGAHDIRGFAKGVARAFSATWADAGRTLTRLHAWRPYRLYWREFAKLFLCVLLMAISVSILIVLMIAEVSKVPLVGFVLNPICWVIVQLWAVFATTLLVTSSFADVSEARALRTLRDGRELLLKYFNLIALIFWSLLGLVYLIRQIPSVIMRTVAQGPLVKKFLVLTFRYVHSEQRTTSFMVSAVGAFVGTVMGSVTMGLAFGLPFGVILAYVIAPRVAKIDIPAPRAEEA